MHAPLKSRPLDGELFLLKAWALLTVPLQAVLAMVVLRPGDADILVMLEVMLAAYCWAAPFSIAAVLAVMVLGGVEANWASKNGIK